MWTAACTVTTARPFIFFKKFCSVMASSMVVDCISVLSFLVIQCQSSSVISCVVVRPIVLLYLLNSDMKNVHSDSVVFMSISGRVTGAGL